MCLLAAEHYRLRALTVATSHQNVASQKVLTKAGFVPVSPADLTDIGGNQGTFYRRELAAECKA